MWSRKFPRASLLISFFGLLGLILPRTARADLADLLGIGNISYWLIEKVFFGISWVLMWLGGLIVAFQGWAIGLVLEINSRILSSPVVQEGFGLMLGFANLIFVIIVIVMAIATILRKETYGVKQLLGKIIIMAVVVNFGLVLAGTIVKFSDDMTRYFLDQINPAGGQETSFVHFATVLSRAFQPQQLFIPEINEGDPEVANFLKAVAANEAGNMGALLSSIGGVLLSVVILSIMIIVLGVFGIMLLIRYVELSLLLVLLPVAWASWAVPALNKYWGKWWDKFLKQVFFAPIVVFFLYLGISLSSKLSDVYGDLQINSAAYKGISGILESIFTPLLQNGVGAFVVGSIMMGGIIVANQFSIALADTAQKGVSGVKGWATGAVTRGARRAGTAPFRGTGMRKRADELMKSNTLAGRYLGRGLKAVQRFGGESVSAERAKTFEALSPQQRLEHLATAVSAEDKVALMGLIQKDGNTNKVYNLESYLSPSMFGRFGKSDVLEKINDTSGISLRNLLRRKADLKGVSSPEAAAERLKIERDFGNKLRTLDPKIIASLFSEKGPDNIKLSSDELNEMRSETAKRFAAELAPGLLAKAVESFDSEENFRLFKEAAATAEIKTENDLSEKLKKFAESGAGASILDVHDLFGVTKDKGASAILDAQGKPFIT